MEASTGLEEVLEDPGELRVLVDVEEVREGLHHLPLLEETRRAFLSPARAGRLRREAFLPPAPPPTSHQRLGLCIPSNQLAKQTQRGKPRGAGGFADSRGEALGGLAVRGLGSSGQGCPEAQPVSDSVLLPSGPCLSPSALTSTPTISSGSRCPQVSPLGLPT